MEQTRFFPFLLLTCSTLIFFSSCSVTPKVLVSLSPSRGDPNNYFPLDALSLFEDFQGDLADNYAGSAVEFSLAENLTCATDLVSNPENTGKILDFYSRPFVGIAGGHCSPFCFDEIFQAVPFYTTVFTLAPPYSALKKDVISLWTPWFLEEAEALLLELDVMRLGIIEREGFEEDFESFLNNTALEIFPIEPEVGGILDEIEARDLHYVLADVVPPTVLPDLLCAAMQRGLTFPNVVWIFAFHADNFWEGESPSCNLTAALIGSIELKVDLGELPYLSPTGAVMPSLDDAGSHLAIAVEFLNALWLPVFAIENFIAKYGEDSIPDLMSHTNSSISSAFQQTVKETEFLGVNGMPVSFDASGRRRFNMTIYQRASSGALEPRRRMSRSAGGVLHLLPVSSFSSLMPFSGAPQFHLDGLMPFEATDDQIESIGLGVLVDSTTRNFEGILEAAVARVNELNGETLFRLANVHLLDSKCETAVVSRKFVQHLTLHDTERREVATLGMIGPLCLESADGVRALDNLANPKTFGFRKAALSMAIPEAVVESALIPVMTMFGWSRLMVISNAALEVSLANVLLRRNISVVTQASISERVSESIVYEMERVDARIILVHAKEEDTVRVLCQFFLSGKRGSDIVWLLSPFIDKNWLRKNAGASNCTFSELQKVAVNVLSSIDWLYARDSAEDDIVTASGETRAEWVKESAPLFSPHYEMLHDLVWLVGVGLKSSIEQTNTRTESDPRLLPHFLSTVSHHRFFGMTGNVSFDADGQRESYVVITKMLPNGTWVSWGKIHSSQISSGDVEVLRAELAPQWQISDGSTPRENQGVAVWLIILLVLLSTLLFLTLLWVAKSFYQSRKAQGEKEKAVHVDSVKSIFLGNISHQLRTPLNGVRGLTASLLQKLKQKDQQECLKSIALAAGHLETIIGSILDYCRLESNEIVLKEEPCNVRDMLEEVTLLTWLPRGPVTLTVRVDDEIDWIMGDPTRLRQIVGNFLGNASKFTYSGKVSVVATLKDPRHRSSRDETPQGQKLRFMVKDTGLGIPKSAQPMLFERFFRVSGEDQLQATGTGLGLPICKRLSEMMNGTVDCHSKESAGSTFWLTVPFAPVDNPNTVSTHSVIVPRFLEQVKVMLVQHSLSGTESILQPLKRLGLENVRLLKPAMAKRYLKVRSVAEMKSNYFAFETEAGSEDTTVVNVDSEESPVERVSSPVERSTSSSQLDVPSSANSVAGIVMVIHAASGMDVIEAVLAMLKANQKRREADPGSEPPFTVVLIQLKAPVKGPGRPKFSSPSSSTYFWELEQMVKEMELHPGSAQTLVEPLQTSQVGLAIANTLAYIHKTESLEGILQTSQIRNNPLSPLGVTSFQQRNNPFLPPQPEQEVSLSTLRVLVAEDNVINQRVIVQSLALCGVAPHNILLCCDGQEGFDEYCTTLRLGASFFDLAIIDVHMPVRTGLEMVKLMRRFTTKYHVISTDAYCHEMEENEFFCRMKRLSTMFPWVVAHSASALPEDQMRAYNAGFISFLPKPLALASLKELLAKFCDLRSRELKICALEEYCPEARKMEKNERKGKEISGKRQNKLGLRFLQKYRVAGFKGKQYK